MPRAAGVPNAGPAVPTPWQREALESYLRNDDSTLGDVWRRLEAGESPGEIQRARRARTANFVWNYQQKLRALLDGVLPDSKTLVREIAGLFRSLATNRDFDEDTRDLLARNGRSTESALLEELRSTDPDRGLGDYLDALDRLPRSGDAGGGDRHHELLLVLWNLARVASAPGTASRTAGLEDIQAGLDALGEAPRFDAAGPFWRLRREALLWDVPDAERLERPGRSEPPERADLLRAAVRGGFAEELDDRIRSDPEFRDGFARHALSLIDPPTRHAVLPGLGLEGLGVDVDRVVQGLQARVEAVLAVLAAPANRGSLDRLKGLVEVELPRTLQRIPGAPYTAEGRARPRPVPEVPAVEISPRGRGHGPPHGPFVVYLFAADGSSLYLCLACATGGLRRNAVQKRVLDMRDACGKQPLDEADVRLRGSAVAARTLELGCAYAVRYERGTVPSEDALVHDLERFSELLTRALDAGVDFERPENSHYVLKWSTDVDPQTVERVRSIADERGSAWWGNRGSAMAMSAEHLRALERRLPDANGPTEAVVYRRDECWTARILEVTDELPSIEEGRPINAAPEECTVFFRLCDLEPRDPSWPLRHLVPVTDPRPDAISRALSTPTTPLEVYRRRFVPRSVEEEIYVGDEPPLTMDWLAEQTLWDRTELQEIVDALVTDSRQVVLAGPPGTGKSWVATQLARYVTADAPAAHRIVQFHPSYGYEEFVEGLRPASDGHGITFTRVDGAVLTMAAIARKNIEQAHVLVIDEMNRANLPRVFGELMYLFENRNVPVDLLYTKDFELPANLMFVGTMNTADRSIRTIDTALRRRFEVFDCPPSPAVLERYYSAGTYTNEVDDLVQGFAKLNGELEDLIDPHHTIGHTFFMATPLTPRRLRKIWRRQVFPLLEEYFFDQPDQVREFTLTRFWPSLDAHD